MQFSSSVLISAIGVTIKTMPNDDKLFLSGRNVKEVSNNNSKGGNHHAFTLRPGWNRGDGEDFLELVSQADKQTPFPLILIHF